MNRFSIEYPEHYIAEILQKTFPKGDNYSVSIPLSRQQKYYDLLLFNANNRKCITIQVKSSRTYVKAQETKRNSKYHFYSWLNNFKKTNEYTDFYFLYISYPEFDPKTFSPKAGFNTKILVFTSREMDDILKSIKTKREGKADRFFGFGFDIDDERIFGTRGFVDPEYPEFTSNLYNKRLEDIRVRIND